MGCNGKRGEKKQMAQAETEKVKSKLWQSNKVTVNSSGGDRCHWQHVSAPQQSSFRKHSRGHSEVPHISERLFKFRRKKTTRVWHEWFFFVLFSSSAGEDDTVKPRKHMWALFYRSLEQHSKHLSLSEKTMQVCRSRCILIRNIALLGCEIIRLTWLFFFKEKEIPQKL